MTPAEFRAALIDLDMTVMDFARALQDHGDPRPWDTIRRTAFTFGATNRTTPLPWSVPVILRLLAKVRAAEDLRD